MIFIALINPLFPYTTLFRSCRPPLNEECATLREWRFNYDIETLGAPASDETRRRATHYLDVQIAEGNAWVAVENEDRKSTRLNSSHVASSYAVFCLKKKKRL